MKSEKLPALSAPSIASSDASMRSSSTISLLEDLRRAEKSPEVATRSDSYSAQPGPSKPAGKFTDAFSKLSQAFSLSAYKRERELKKILRADIAQIPALEAAGRGRDVPAHLNQILQTARTEKLNVQRLFSGAEDIFFHALLADDQVTAQTLANEGLYHADASNTGLAIGKQDLTFGPLLYKAWTDKCATLVGKDSPNTAAQRRADLAKIQQVLINTRNPGYITQVVRSPVRAARLAASFGDVLLASEIIKRAAAPLEENEALTDGAPPDYQHPAAR